MIYENHEYRKRFKFINMKVEKEQLDQKQVSFSMAFENILRTSDNTGPRNYVVEKVVQPPLHLV